MTALTAEIGRFVSELRYEDIPEEALPTIRAGFSDTVGVMMVGVVEPVTQIVLKTAIETGGRHEARACLSGLKTSAADAALIGGAAAHALDYDDQSLSGHPSAVLVPPLLAEGEMLGSSGRDLVTAYMAGYEVWAELVRRGSNYHKRGWHPTSVFGVVATAAAICSLHHLSAERTAAALAIAASHAGGLAANFGTMTKPYHAGMAGRAGIVSVRMAAAGMSAGEDTLENKQGFLTAYSDSAPDWDSPPRLGKDWYILRQGLCFKKYPTCYFMHRSFDATVQMLANRNIKANDIENIDVTMGRGQTVVLVNDRPRTGLEGKFSEQFAMAAAVILGRMGVNEVVDEVVKRPDFQAFYPKVNLIPTDSSDPRDPVFSPSERVKIKLKGGDMLDSGEITSAHGQPSDPLTLDEHWEKFADCTAKTHSPSEAKELFGKLQAVETLRSTADLPTCTTIFNA